MDLFDKIDDVLEQEDNILKKNETQVKVDYSFDEDIFNKMANFIINLNIDSLSEKQIQEVIEIIESIEVETEGIEESGSPKMSRMSSVGRNSYSKKWYRLNKARVKKKKKEFMRSSEGRKKLKKKERRKGKEIRDNKYHTRNKSDRNSEYEKREYGK